MKQDKNQQVFFELLRAGLWEKDVRLLSYGVIDYNAIYKLAQEQSVVGLLAAGLEHVADVKVPRALSLTIAGEVLQLEQRNKAMNRFVAETVDKLRKAGVYTLIVKGQGVAQCYGRPLWRACGDVDFFLNEDNFVRMRELIRPYVDCFDPNDDKARNVSATMEGWPIELHGNQFTGLSTKVDKVLKEVHDKIFIEGSVRSWMDDKTQIFLPVINEDVIIIFTHFLKHFYKGGLGLRQICDWCRLLYTYRESLNYGLLESRIKRMGLMTEWKAFASYAVEWLGMPIEAIPFYSSSRKWTRKARQINSFVMEVGNMGHNRSSRLMVHDSWLGKQYVVRKVFSMFRRIGDLINHARIFPMDSVRFFTSIFKNGIIAFGNRRNYKDYQRICEN